MRFLVVGKNKHLVPPGVFPVLSDAMLAWVSKYKGKMDEVCAFAGIQGGGGVFSVESLEELERVGIVAFNERGRRISVVLDRKRYKRCDFLFLKKSYKGRPGESYEQVFWLTQRAIEQHRPAFKFMSRHGKTEFIVCIHSNERYPWRFPGAVTEHGTISACSWMGIGCWR